MLKELKGAIGDSDLAGELSLTPAISVSCCKEISASQIFVVDELTGYAPEKNPGVWNQRKSRCQPRCRKRYRNARRRLRRASVFAATRLL